ncbi:MAG: STAS domain-containing protein [Planctomycetota bacterium]|jgi:anti-anti-sigma factor
MQIGQKAVGAVAILDLDGEFDAANLKDAAARLDALIGLNAQVILNLRRLRFINSLALGYLLKTSKRLAERGGELVMTEPSPSFIATIRTLGIDQVFRVFPTDYEAIDYFTGLAEDATGTFGATL